MNDRINDGLLRQLLDEGGACPACNISPDSSECKRGWGLEGYPLAMVYAPVQKFENIYDMEKALSAGTIFKDLDLPFMGVTVTKGGNCRG